MKLIDPPRMTMQPFITLYYTNDGDENASIPNVDAHASEEAAVKFGEKQIRENGACEVFYGNIAGVLRPELTIKRHGRDTLGERK